MKGARLLSSAIILTGFCGLEPSTLWARHVGILFKAPASEGSYCHLKFPAIREETLSWDQPVLKDASSGDIIDFYGPCDYDPHGKDAIQTQKRDLQRRWQREYNS